MTHTLATPHISQAGPRTMPNLPVSINTSAHLNAASSTTVLKVETKQTPRARQAQAVVLSDGQ